MTNPTSPPPAALPDWLSDAVRDGICTPAIASHFHQRLTEERTKALEEAAAAIPTNWCDSLLTGKPGTPIPAMCPDIERLLHGIAARIRAKAEGGEI